MRYPICCMRDQLTGFMNPFVAANIEVAQRDFKILINDDKQSLHYNPQHFDLYKVGEFDTDTGKIEPIEPELVLTGLSVLEQK